MSMKIEICPYYQMHQPEFFLENETQKILWDFEIKIFSYE